MSKKEKKKGGMKLLGGDDFDKKNPWDKPVVGWRPTSQGEGGLYNPMGLACLRVVNRRFNEEKDEYEDLYDQVQLYENPGAVVITQTEDGRIGLVRQFRMVGKRPLYATYRCSNYIQKVNDNMWWEEVLDTLGRWKWEAPRGIAEVDSIALENALLEIAKTEALEESGYVITDAVVAGKVNPNSTFFAHPQYVVYARIESVGENNPEETEMIGESRLFTTVELREMIKRGELDDGLTLAALTICGISL